MCLILMTATESYCHLIIIISWHGCKHFPNDWPFARGIHRSPVDSPHKGPVTISLMLSLMLTWTRCWTNSQVAIDFRCHVAYVTSLQWQKTQKAQIIFLILGLYFYFPYDWHTKVAVVSWYHQSPLIPVHYGTWWVCTGIHWADQQWVSY